MNQFNGLPWVTPCVSGALIHTPYCYWRLEVVSSSMPFARWGSSMARKPGRGRAGCELGSVTGEQLRNKWIVVFSNATMNHEAPMMSNHFWESLEEVMDIFIEGWQIMRSIEDGQVAEDSLFPWIQEEPVLLKLHVLQFLHKHPLKYAGKQW